MKTLEEMTKEERSLLLFLETRAVDHRGRVESTHMNAEDMGIAKQWDNDGFILFGRVCANDIQPGLGSHWCKLSDEAWALAHHERKARADRMWSKRSWQTAAEANKR